MNPDIEKVVSLNPTLYISDINLQDDLEPLLDQHNINSIFVDNSSIDSIIESLELMGKALNEEEEVQKIVNDMRKRESKILESIEGKESPKVLVIFGTPQSFMLATEHSYVGGLVKTLGGINLTDEISSQGRAPYVNFSLEEVAHINPDVILRLSHMNPQMSKEAFDKEFQNPFWQNLDAVKNNQVYDLDSRLFGVTGNIRAVDALEELKNILY